jgi:hypothetical protein
VAIVSGEKPPAVSIQWERPRSQYDSGFCVLYSDYGAPERAKPVCLNCLIEDGDEQLGAGLDLAREHGQVDWDAELEEWFIPIEEVES